MQRHKIIEFDDLMLESDGHELLENIEHMQEHIKATVPDEILYGQTGEINARTKWGSVYMHLTMARATLRAFL